MHVLIFEIFLVFILCFGSLATKWSLISIANTLFSQDLTIRVDHIHHDDGDDVHVNLHVLHHRVRVDLLVMLNGLIYLVMILSFYHL